MAGSQATSTPNIKQELCNQLVVDDWCHTDCKEITFSYLWTIANFSLCQKKVGECLVSSVFKVGSQNNQSSWYLELYPNGSSEDKPDFVAVYLSLDDVQGEEKSVCVTRSELAIVDVNGQKVNKKVDNIGQHFKKEESSGEEFFIKRETLMQKADTLLPNDQLTLFCSVNIVSEWVTTHGKKATTSSRDRPEIAESNEINREVCQEMLKFIKTLKPPKPAESFNAGISSCHSVVAEMTLTTGNAVQEMIQCYVKQRPKRFKDNVIKFIVEHFSAVKKSSGWRQAVIHYPHIVVDVFDALAKKIFPQA